jgi:hypothetical protein
MLLWKQLEAEAACQQTRDQVQLEPERHVSGSPLSKILGSVQISSFIFRD